MSRLDEVLAFNRKFVENREYEPYLAGKYPRKQLVIVSCMDTRMTELLPKALNLKNGDVKIIKTAGALISHPYGSVMRSLLVAVTLLKADEVWVIGHHGCGMVGLSAEPVLSGLRSRGVPPENVQKLRNRGVDVDRWLTGCNTAEDGVKESVSLLRNHPLWPPDVMVHGLVIDPCTGELTLIDDGRNP
ncbi:beta-class carbonic anhydrase [Staphylospora marina]|uniref:beta-class carbonic anhydrase n=1 Tax=Staphylospora marina TaxID=2490858 RepID=UPI000F5C137E|nr:carbonic anhydrase [Staphylospora marina]